MSYALIVAKAKAKKEAESSSDSSSSSNNNISKKGEETAVAADSDKETVDSETPVAADGRTGKFEVGRGRGRTQLPRSTQYRNTARRDYDRMPVRK